MRPRNSFVHGNLEIPIPSIPSSPAETPRKSRVTGPAVDTITSKSNCYYHKILIHSRADRGLNNVPLGMLERIGVSARQVVVALA